MAYAAWPREIRSIAAATPAMAAAVTALITRGTVWLWLLGPCITAYMKVNGGSNTARKQAEEWLAPLKGHLADGGLGHISEIFDGDAPHRPVGCIAQAWSLAEVFRAAVEDVWGTRAEQSAVPLEVVAQQPSETKPKRAAS